MARGWVAGLVLAALPAAAAAQERLPDMPRLPDPLPTPAMVSGRVVTPGAQREAGVPGVVVTLHRVGPDSAGALDSVLTDAAGRYTIRYRRFGSEEAVYFAAALYRGIAYFSAPLRGARASGEDAEITVFDTTTGPIPLTVQGHHLVVSAPKPDGSRDVVEVYEISNDTIVTAVGRDSTSAVWTAPIPPSATNFVAGQGDVSPITLTRRGDRVALAAAFGPGVKQISYSYTLPERAFPWKFALERQAGVFEVLLEEQGAQVRSASLHSQGNATTQGRTFKRFLSQGALQGEAVRIDVPTAAGGTRTRVLIGLAVVIGLAMIGTFARALLRRGPPSVTGVSDTDRTPEALAAAIAALDARHEAGDATLPAERYSAERAALKTRLAAALADESGVP